MKILSIVRNSVDKQQGYVYLQEIVVKWENKKEYILKEDDFPSLYLNDIEDMFLLYMNETGLADADGDADSEKMKRPPKENMCTVSHHARS
ncbi:hypothetical protein Tco_1393244 [Tanacetum coccineum]